MKKYFSKKRHGFTPVKKYLTGFTLIELLIVCTIIAVLAVVAIVSYNSARIKSRDSKRISDSQTIGAALEQYYEANGEYPNSKNCGVAGTLPDPSWCDSVLVANKGTLTGGQWIKDTTDSKTLIDFLSVVPVDPINDTPTATGTIDPNAYFYYAYSATGTDKLQTYYLVMTLEDKNNTFVTQNQGVAGDSNPCGTGTVVGCAAGSLASGNGSRYYKFTATAPTTTGAGIVTLGRNRSDTRVLTKK